MVRFWLLHVVSKDIASSIIFDFLTLNVWTDLNERYAQYNTLCLLGAHPLFVPMEYYTKLLVTKGEFLHDPSSYCRLIGQLIYLTITRLDITYNIHVLNQFMSQPCQPYLDAVLCLVCYIKSSLGLGILFFLPFRFATLSILWFKLGELLRFPSLCHRILCHAYFFTHLMEN